MKSDTPGSKVNLPRRTTIMNGASSVKYITCVAFLSLCGQGFGQTYTYDPSAGGDNTWGNSAKWGLPSGYPSGDGITVNLPKISAATGLSFADATSVTVGTLNIGVGGAGAGAWTLQNNG